MVGEGTAKITVSAVSSDAKGKYKAIKKTFTIKATPKCEQIIFKADRVTYKATAKDTAKVVVNIKQQVPKKANDTITWYVLKDSQLIEIPANSKAGVNDKKCTFTVSDIKNKYAENGVVTVIAKTGTVEAKAKIVCP